jgi:hypothetical protein
MCATTEDCGPMIATVSFSMNFRAKQDKVEIINHVSRIVVLSETKISAIGFMETHETSTLNNAKEAAAVGILHLNNQFCACKNT